MPEPRTPAEEFEEIAPEEDPPESTWIPEPRTPPEQPEEAQRVSSEEEVTMVTPNYEDTATSTALTAAAAPLVPKAVKVTAMPKKSLWKPRRVSLPLAQPVEPPSDPPQREIRGSVGRLLQQRRQQPLVAAAKSNTFASRTARQLINRTTAAKSKPKASRIPAPASSIQGPSEPTEPSGSMVLDPPAAKAAAAAVAAAAAAAAKESSSTSTLPPHTPASVEVKEEPLMEEPGPSVRQTADTPGDYAPELVHPVFDQGEICSFAAIGKMRSAPDPTNPDREIWHMQLGDDPAGPLLPLHQLPSWITLH